MFRYLLRLQLFMIFVLPFYLRKKRTITEQKGTYNYYTFILTNILMDMFAVSFCIEFSYKYLATPNIFKMKILSQRHISFC